MAEEGIARRLRSAHWIFSLPQMKTVQYKQDFRQQEYCYDLCEAVADDCLAISQGVRVG